MLELNQTKFRLSPSALYPWRYLSLGTSRGAGHYTQPVIFNWGKIPHGLRNPGDQVFVPMLLEQQLETFNRANLRSFPSLNAEHI